MENLSEKQELCKEEIYTTIYNQIWNEEACYRQDKDCDDIEVVLLDEDEDIENLPIPTTGTLKYDILGKSFDIKYSISPNSEIGRKIDIEYSEDPTLDTQYAQVWIVTPDQYDDYQDRIACEE